ncbi:RepA leader peptide Tap [Salmonella enterica]
MWHLLLPCIVSAGRSD